MRRGVIGSLLLAGVVAGVDAQSVRDLPPPPVGAPQRDASVSARGTAVISGTVLSDTTPAEPIRRATVLVSATGVPGERTTVTDDEGHFVIDGLVAGRYTLTASKPGFVRAAYGAKRPGGTGTAIALTEGHRATVELAMARGGVITGAVINELGEPAAGIEVRAMRYRTQVSGERSLVPVNDNSAHATDRSTDEGIYRLYGLPPGDYVVAVSPRDNPGELRAMTDDEMRAALADLQRVSTGGGSLDAPPAAAPAMPTVGFAPVYFPGTTNQSDAQVVALAAGDVRSGVTIPTPLVRTATISGRVVAPAAVPPDSVQLALVNASIGTAMVGGGAVVRVPVSSDGTFSLGNVRPGRYVLSARTANGQPVMQFSSGDNTMMISTVSLNGGGRGGASNPAAVSGPQLYANHEVSVDGVDIRDVLVSLLPTLSMVGRVALDSGTPAAPGDWSALRVSFTPANSSGLSIVPRVVVEPSGRFTVADLTPGRYRLSATTGGVPGLVGWTAVSASIGGREALDVPVDIAGGDSPGEALIVLSNRSQEISGHLQDANGQPAAEYSVVVIPAVRELWASARRIASVRPDTSGRFVISALPAGDYRIAALTDVSPGDLNDPVFLQMIIENSQPISLAVGEKKVQDFRLAGAR